MNKTLPFLGACAAVLMAGAVSAADFTFDVVVTESNNIPGFDVTFPSVGTRGTLDLTFDGQALDDFIFVNTDEDFRPPESIRYGVTFPGHPGFTADTGDFGAIVFADSGGVFATSGPFGTPLSNGGNNTLADFVGPPFCQFEGGTCNIGSLIRFDIPEDLAVDDLERPFTETERL